MTGAFYHSVIHGLGFFICFKILILCSQNNKTRFFYVLYSDKTWVFDQSESGLGPIYILMFGNITIIVVYNIPNQKRPLYLYLMAYSFSPSGRYSMTYGLVFFV